MEQRCFSCRSHAAPVGASGTVFGLIMTQREGGETEWGEERHTESVCVCARVCVYACVRACERARARTRFSVFQVSHHQEIRKKEREKVTLSMEHKRYDVLQVMFAC